MKNFQTCMAQYELVKECLPLVAREDCFALKGGTAINLFFQNLPRLSVDIDLAYLPIEERTTSLRKIGSALYRIAEDISKNVPGVKVYPIYKGKIKTMYKFRIERRRTVIKVETSPTTRGCVFAPKWSKVQSNVKMGVENFQMKVASELDTYAGKFMAALERQNARDFFDVHSFYKKSEVTKDLRDTFLVYFMSGAKSAEDYLSLKPIGFKDDYNDNLKSMMIENASLHELKLTREHMAIDLSAGMPKKHKEFIYTFYEGRPDWSLVDVPNFESFPAVQWKLLHVSRMELEARRGVLKRIENSILEMSNEIANYSGPDGPRSRYYQSSQEEIEIQNEKNEQRTSDYLERDFGSNDEHEQTVDNDPYDGNPPTFSM